MRSALDQPWLQSIAVGCFGFVVYLLTLAPGSMWYDMGEYQAAAYTLGIAHNTGYPLYLLLGKLFTFIPIGEIGLRVGLLSALCGALTALILYWMVFHLTGSMTASLIAGLTLAVTSTLWGNATWAEVYNLNAAVTLLILYLALRWLQQPRQGYLRWAVLVFGLGLGNHRLILAAGLALALVYFYLHLRSLLDWSWPEMLRLAGLFLLGFSVHLYLPLRALGNPPVMWADASQPATFLQMITTGYAASGAFYNPLGNLTALRIWVKMLSAFPVYEWTVPGLLIAALGLYRLLRQHRVFATLTLIVALFTAVVISIYGIHDIFNYFLPIYLMVGIWFGVGVASLLNWVGESLPPALQSQFEFLTPRRRVLLFSLLALTIPFYLLLRSWPVMDRSDHHDPMDFARYIFDRVEPGAVVLVDFWSWTPLLYGQEVRGIGRDVAVIPAHSLRDVDVPSLIEDFMAAEIPVYIASRQEDRITEQEGEYRVQLLAPYSIHSLTTDVVPAPQYKDLLIPRGSVSQAVPFGKDLTVDRVPSEHQISASIGEELWLLGFHFEPQQLRPGDPFQVHYYWRLESASRTNYWVDVLFTDERGGVDTLGGFPLWLHSHWLGGGAYPTSEWPVGETVREVYDGLVPRRVKPGTYQIRLLIYEKGVREGFIPASGPLTMEGRVLAGEVVIKP